MLKVLCISEFPDKMEIDKWYCSMLWCPSQCYMHVKDNDRISHILYLRWRWNDPWQARIVKGAYNESSMYNADWGIDIFEQRGLYFTDEETEDAKAALIEIWEKKILMPEIDGRVWDQVPNK